LYTNGFLILSPKKSCQLPRKLPKTHRGTTEKTGNFSPKTVQELLGDHLLAYHPRNRSYNAEIGSSAIDFVFKPLMQRYQHANYIFAMFSPIR
jgi:hypothetical protein